MLKDGKRKSFYAKLIWNAVKGGSNITENFGKKEQHKQKKRGCMGINAMQPSRLIIGRGFKIQPSLL